MHIVSLLPSATEILFALGLGDQVCGITHECDFPAEARAKRVVVHSKLPHDLSSAQIDRVVSEYIGRGESLYAVDAEALQEIAPDLIVTQDLCHVCAASPDDLGAALSRLPRRPQVVSLNPRTLTDVWRDVLTVGEATGRAAEALSLVTQLEERVAAVEGAVAGISRRPRVACLEWLDPFYCGGHWVPEMVSRAGGQDVLGRLGEPSFRVTAEQILGAQPDVILAMPCGYGADRAATEYSRKPFPDGWNELPAVREGRVFAVDASGYFSRPGPRLADGVEILSAVIHPELAVPPILAGVILRVGETAYRTAAL